MSDDVGVTNEIPRGAGTDANAVPLGDLGDLENMCTSAQAPHVTASVQWSTLSETALSARY